MAESYANPDALVSTEWLAAHLAAPDVRVVDGSFKLRGVAPTAREDYERRHIPGAVFFDVDEIADEASPLPHMLPSSEKFAARMRKMGLGDGNRIVVYDTAGLVSAARVWWMFRVFGHRDIAILDGGLPKWLAEGRPVDDLTPHPRERHFTSRFDGTLVRSKAQILQNVEARREQVVDARAVNRFEGSVDEPRPGLRRGHIPGSLNVPIDRLTDPQTKTVRPAAELRRLFEEAGVDLGRPVAATCGSGVTACGVAFGLYLLGRPDVAVYDGSWSEWGLPGDTPIETGPAKSVS
jgi:thiosulfate/3-mercaptopyruvate sulfurtransferase